MQALRSLKYSVRNITIVLSVHPMSADYSGKRNMMRSVNLFLKQLMIILEMNLDCKFIN